MLVNKLIIEYGYMFIRSTDLKYLKYIMDLGISPLVVDCTNNVIISLHYIRPDHIIDYRCVFDLPNIRPLTISEIKKVLTHISMVMLVHKNYELYLWEIFFMYFPQTYIDRNKLWKKY